VPLRAARARPAWSAADGRRLLAAFARELATLEGGFSARGFLAAMQAQALERVGSALAPRRTTRRPPGSRPSPRRTRPRRRGARRTPGRWPSSSRASPRSHAGATFARGRAAYEAASCNRCHRLAGEGASLGPDLTGAAGRYSARDLLLATLEPAREVPDVWRDLELWGADGLLALGRVESERDGELVVRDSSGARVTLPAALVTERTPHRLSRMPEGCSIPSRRARSSISWPTCSRGAPRTTRASADRGRARAECAGAPGVAGASAAGAILRRPRDERAHRPCPRCGAPLDFTARVPGPLGTCPACRGGYLALVSEGGGARGIELVPADSSVRPPRAVARLQRPLRVALLALAGVALAFVLLGALRAFAPRAGWLAARSRAGCWSTFR
jgi:putative heme-binding domain-containing protein